MVDFPGLSRDDINRFTLRILECVQPRVTRGKEAFDVDRFIEILEDEMSIDFDFTYDLPSEVHGCTATIDNKVLIQAELADDPWQIRYLRSTVTHECGHVLLHLPLLRKFSQEKTFTQKKMENQGLNLYSNKPKEVYKDPEWQAWEFTGSILMPKPALVTLAESGMSLRDMADHFIVNKVFLRSRMKKLKMV